MKRILFVDDESTILDGIRRAMYADRNRWDMHFMLGAEQAMQACEQASFDVVVSDMRMPGTDGATLLAQIRKRFPGTTRIVLSGYSDAALATRAASDAHRILAKPCNASELRDTIERVLALRDLVASPTIQQIVGGVGKLPSLSATYSSLTEAVRNPNTSIGDVAEIIERDIAMAAKVLQLTNSAFFGLAQHVSNLSSAVSYLGIATIKSLALTSEAFGAFKPGPKVPSSVCDAIEDHAVRVAAIVAALPVPTQIRDVSIIAGLLHDIGKLFLASKMPDEYLAIAARVTARVCTWSEAEMEVLGTSHAEIGAYLLGLWGIPELAVEAIAHHHHPDRISHPSFDCTEALFIANVLAHEIEAKARGLIKDVREERDRELIDRFGLLPRMEEFRDLAAESCKRLGNTS